MKRLTFFLFFIPIFVVNFGFSITEVGRLNKKMISQHAHAIAKKITMDRYKVVALMCLGTGMQLLALQKFLNKSQDVSLLTKPKQDRGPFLEELLSGIHKSVDRLKYIFFTGGGLWNMTTFVAKTVGELGLYVFSQKMIASFMHPDTLYWYVTSCVPCIKTVAVMKEATKQLTTGTAHEIQKNYYPQLIVDGCNQLVYYGEHICAYMCYKSTQLPELQKSMALREASYMFDYHNRWLKNMNGELSSEQPDYAKILELIDSYQTEIKRHLHYFEAIEAVQE